MAVSIADHLPLAEVKNRLSEVVEQVETEHARVTITKRGRPAAVLISADDLDSLEETLTLLSDPGVMAQVRESREEFAARGRAASDQGRVARQDSALTWEVRWTAAAQRAWERLPEKVATACIKFVYSRLADNPHRADKPLRFELEGVYGARRGDYRVLYTIEDHDESITVVAIQHRADAYRVR